MFKSIKAISLFFIAVFFTSSLTAQYVSIYKTDASGNTVLKSQAELQDELSRSAQSDKTYFRNQPEKNDNSGSDEFNQRIKEEMEKDAAQKAFYEVLGRNCFLHLEKSDGFACFKNNSGKTILGGDYDYAKELVEDKNEPSAWIVGKNGKYSLYGRNDTVMNFKASDYKWISRVYHDLNGIDYFFLTGADDKMGLLECSSSEMRGDMLIPVSFDSIGVQWYDADKQIPVKSNGKWGIWDCSANTLAAPCIYDSISSNHALAYSTLYDFFVKKDNKWGVYNVQNRMEIIPAQYDKIASCKYSLSAYSLNASGAYSISYNFPSYVGITGTRKIYFDQQFKIYTPGEIPFPFENFILPDWEEVKVPDEIKPHKKSEWHSSKFIDCFFSFDTMKGILIDNTEQ